MWHNESGVILRGWLAVVFMVLCAIMVLDGLASGKKAQVETFGIPLLFGIGLTVLSSWTKGGNKGA